jgi:two-component system, NarL family, response regulator NreC
MRVLIVDDDFGYRRLMRRVLEAEPDVALVFGAADGEEALRLAQQFKPDVVLMDVDMPGSGMDGLEATRRIKESVAGVAVIILSALDNDASRERAVECGADAHLPKSSSIFEILSAIRNLRPTKAA